MTSARNESLLNTEQRPVVSARVPSRSMWPTLSETCLFLIFVTNNAVRTLATYDTVMDMNKDYRRIAKPVVAQGHKRATVKVFPFLLEEMDHLLYLFPRSDNGAKHSVEFRHSTYNSSRIRRKVGNRRMLMGTECIVHWFSLPILLCKGYS